MADGYLNFDTKINTDGFNKGVASIGKMVDSVGNTVSGMGKAFLPVTAAVTGVGIAAGKTAIDFTKLYESTMVVFDKMLGGKQAANALYSSLLSIAKASTFSQEAFLTAGKKLVGMGISARDTAKYMQAITDAVAGFGGNSENLTNVAENFAKISTAGRLSMEDVNMLSDNGIQALKILGNQYGITTDEMRDMISKGAVPAKDAMDKLADGIENGTDGVNGMTAAMAGMSMAMKGKTITGALDSLNSGFRGFALNLTGINPTLKETDAGYEESTQRLQQLTAAISTIANILPSVSTLFNGITDGIGKLLDKVVGANIVFDEATGKWQNVGGVLGTIQEKLDSMNPDKLVRIGNVILSMATAGAVLPVLGGGISKLGGVLGGLSGIIGPAEKAISGLPKTFSIAGSGIKGFTKDLGNVKEAILLPMQEIGPKMSGILSGMSEMWSTGPGGKMVCAVSGFTKNISEKFGSIGPAL
ncbi:MAG: tape measure protein, partial [Clostridium sp.]